MIQPNYTQFTPQYPQPNGANAVSINIFNPQAYGSAPQGMQQQAMVSQPSMYQMPQAQMYQMPQAQMYQMPQAQMYQMPQAQETYYQPYVVTQPQVVQTPQVVAAPAPQVMPESVMEEAKAPEKSVEEVKQEKPEAEKVNVDELVGGLKNSDQNVRLDAINKIAKCAQDAPEVALQVVSEPVMQGLVDIIKEDTNALEGPSQKQIDIAKKSEKGEKLTDEETALLNELSPRDMANRNRIFALYTLAMIQKLQRDELNQYIETQKKNGEQPINSLKIEDLIGYNDIVNIINNDSRPEVKVAAIQALQYVAEPEDKEAVQKVLAESSKSGDEAVKNAANEVLNKFKA